MLNRVQRRTRAKGLVRAVAIVLLAVGTLGPGATAAPAAFHAAGSVEQVYVTGLAPKAEASLISPQGETLLSRSTDVGWVRVRSARRA